MDVKPEWTKELTLEFIQKYERHPILWNDMHNDHKNLILLREAWLAIAYELSCPMSVYELRKKKECLMSTYRIAAKKVRETAGTNEPYKPRWYAYYALDKFLAFRNNPKIKNTPSSSSSDSSSDVDTSNGIEFLDYDDDTSSEETYNESFGGITIPHDMGAAERDTVKRGRENTNLTESNVPKHFKIEDIMENPEDGPALFARLLADKLRKLSKRNQLVLQNQIDNLVFKVQLQECDSEANRSMLSSSSIIGYVPIPLNDTQESNINVITD